MKKALSVLALTLTLLLLVCAKTRAPSSANPDEVSLNAAIRGAASRMESRLEKGTKVALINFTSPSQAFSEYVLDELSSSLVNGGSIVVVDRANLEKVRQELGFNMSGAVSDSSMQEIGNMLGAQAIVTGTLSNVGDLYRVMFKVIMTESAAVSVQYPADIMNDRRVQTLLAQGGGSKAVAYGVAGEGGSSGASVTPASTEQSAPALASVAPVAAVPAVAAVPVNGTYTFWPRPQAMQAGLPAEIWIPQIIVTKEFIVIFFAGGPSGDFSDGRGRIYFNPWREANNVQLQDLDSPARFYKPVSINYHSNGGGALYSMSFNRFPAKRFKLSCNFHNEPPQVFEEIAFGEPDE